MLLNIRWGSLRAKVIAWFFVPSAVVLLAAAVLAFIALDDPRARWLVLSLLALSLLAPAVVVSLGVKRIAMPIAQLTHLAQEVAQGRFGQTITADTGDEIEELAHQFNLMAGQLKEAYTYLEQRVEDRTHELETLNAIAAVASRSLHRDEVLSGALEVLLKRLNLETGAVFLLDEDRKQLVWMAQRGFPPDFEPVVRTLGAQGGISGEAVTGRKPVVMSAESYLELNVAPGRIVEWLEKERVQLLISAPVLHQDQALGCITLATRRQRIVPEHELELLQAVGQQLGMALENARLYEQAQNEIAERKRIEAALQQANAEGARRNRELALINRVITATTSNLEPKAILETVCCELVEAFEVAQSAAALMDPGGVTLTVVAERRAAGGPSALGVVIPVQENPATLFVLKNKAPLALTDAQHDILTTPVHALMRERGVVSLLLLPLIVRDEVIGTIGLDALEAREFSQDEMEMAERIAAAVAQALERAAFRKAV